ncbi:Hypothetical predicted protein [Mytilus galloprovincialis]|uniref:Chromo domain-containing protein n=2 Tax=Mytilus galloprovincialis TaxID=29158 RepID=A0A8B6BJ70_MYTGA|nr:Hypothetical predicted protein [Mytilus galloprovincialis]
MNEKLEEAWNAGMKQAGKQCKESIENVANVLEIETERAKEWIGNRNARERRLNGEAKPTQKKVVIAGGTNAYALFAKTIKRVSGKKWRRLTGLSLGKRLKRSGRIPIKGSLGILSQLKIINQACETLDSIGYSVCGIGCNREKDSAPDIFGTKDAVQFFDCDIEQKFNVFFSGKKDKNASNIDKSCKEGERKELKQLVRKHFNAAWANSTNLGTQVPYIEINVGSIKVDVEGLPDGMVFKEPSSYGKDILRSNMLKARVTFKIRKTELSEDEVNSNGDHNIEDTTAISVEDAKKRKQEGGKNGVSDINRFERPGCSSSTDVNKRKQGNKKGNIVECKRNKKPVEIQEGIDLSAEDVEMLSPLLLDDATQELVDPSQDELYKIERIMKTRKRKQKTESLVKWEGCDELTWIPQEDIKNI